MKCVDPALPTWNSIVAPLAGAWIEIEFKELLSTPDYVAPLAGAWIEIVIFPSVPFWNHVAPLAGAWIEIAYTIRRQLFQIMSLPSRERGLK